jgi:hypothetical protein
MLLLKLSLLLLWSTVMAMDPAAIRKRRIITLQEQQEYQQQVVEENRRQYQRLIICSLNALMEAVSDHIKRC